MKKITTIAILLFLSLSASQLLAQPMSGYWKTIDDATGKPKSVVHIYFENGKMYGQIVETFNGNPDKVCNCSGDKAGKKIVGMIIIDGLQKKETYWAKDDGIFDPEKDTYYDVRIWQDGNELKVRGYIGFLFRTQTWVKA